MVCYNKNCNRSYIKKQIAEKYKQNRKYKFIIIHFYKKKNENASGFFFRFGYSFQLATKSRLLYHIGPNKKRRFCIFSVTMKKLLATVYNKKFHYKKTRMLEALKSLAIDKKTYLMKKYIQFCFICQLNQTDQQPSIGDY